MSELNPPKKGKRRPKQEGAMLPMEIVGEQKLDAEEESLKHEAYARLENWRQELRAYHEQAAKCRKIYRLDDPEQDEPGTRANQRVIQLQTLKSTINNSVADQMDNTHEALMIPERPEVQAIATEMTDVVRFILDQNNYELFHRKRVEDFFITGTAVSQIAWDETMDYGEGQVSLQRIPVENMLWDPMAEDIQDARAIIKLSWHPLSWYAEHYPDKAPYVGDETNAHDNVGIPESVGNVLQPQEGKAMLMEYWYRRFDGKRYSINVAYFAGGALLDKYTDVYAHGRYPFVFDAFTQIAGQPVGEGMVYELAPMMRYINRYADYIDKSLRFNCKPRMLARRGSGINLKQMANWQQDIVEGDTIGDEDIRWFESKPIPPIAMNQMLQFESDMKADSGQNQSSRGEAVGGITAASAISALQEAGGKMTRMRTATLSAGFKDIVEQILWLVAEYYDEDKQRMIIGDNMLPKTIHLSAEYLMGRKAKEGHMPPPPYMVQVQIQRRNPLRIQAQNDLMMQAYTMAAESGHAFPLSVLFQMLNVDGKDRILPVLEQYDTIAQQMQELSQQNQQLAEQNANMKTALESYANALGQDSNALQDNSFGGMETPMPTYTI